MSDSRASVIIEFSIYGETFKTDMWINWFPEDSTGLDRRITDWFIACHNKAYAKYRDRIDAGEEKRNAAQIEAVERAKLKELLEKYPDDGAPLPTKGES